MLPLLNSIHELHPGKDERQQAGGIEAPPAQPGHTLPDIGDAASVTGGVENLASGFYASVNGGGSNVASGIRAGVGGGQSQTASSTAQNVN